MGSCSVLVSKLVMLKSCNCMLLCLFMLAEIVMMGGLMVMMRGRVVVGGGVVVMLTCRVLR